MARVDGTSYDQGSDGAERTVNLGRGVLVPYPVPTSDAATKIGKANRRADTRPEVRLRSELHRRGHRFRKDFLVRTEGLRVRPDIVFSRRRVAVFIDGCFWHSCPQHARTPKSNPDYWIPKLSANSDRDRRVNEALIDAGWTVVRLWEHLPVEDAVLAVEQALESRSVPPRRVRC